MFWKLFKVWYLKEPPEMRHIQGLAGRKREKREKDILDPKIIMTFVDEVFYFLSGNYLNFC